MVFVAGICIDRSLGCNSFVFLYSGSTRWLRKQLSRLGLKQRCREPPRVEICRTIKVRIINGNPHAHNDICETASTGAEHTNCQFH